MSRAALNAALALALAAATAACAAACAPVAASPYSPPVPASFSPCTSSQGHPVLDNSTGQFRCEP
jgi:hypothetical protein